MMQESGDRRLTDRHLLFRQNGLERSNVAIGVSVVLALRFRRRVCETMRPCAVSSKRVTASTLDHLVYLLTQATIGHPVAMPIYDRGAFPVI